MSPVFLLNGSSGNVFLTNVDGKASLTKLAKPTGLRISGTNLQWDAVTNAIKYYVEINSDIFSTSTLYYQLPVDPGTYRLKVMAVGDYINYSNSDFSTDIIHVVDEPGMDLLPPIIDTRTQLISIEDADVWQAVFSFSNPNQANVNIEYGYNWQTPPTTFDYSFSNVGFYANTIEVGVANNHIQVRTLFIIARIEYQGQYTATASASILVQS